MAPKGYKYNYPSVLKYVKPIQQGVAMARAYGEMAYPRGSAPALPFQNARPRINRSAQTSRRPSMSSKAYKDMSLSKRPVVTRTKWARSKFGYGAIRVKPKRRVQDKSFNIKGSVLRYETGGQINDAECVYVGHSVATNKVITSALRAVIKELFRQRGTDILNWDDTIQNGENLRLQYVYTTNAHTAGALTEIDFDVKDGSSNVLTYQGLALKWQQNISDNWGGQAHKIEYVLLFSSTGSQILNYGKVYTSHFYLDFSFDSKLKVQNVTSSSTVGDTEDQLANAINNNPLIGNLYSKNKNQRNGFECVKHQTVQTNFIADSDTGVFTALAATTGFSQFLKKPPPAWTFNAKQVKGLTLHPGEIKYSHITFKANMSFTTFLTKLSVPLSENSLDFAVNFGFAEMFALEKMLDDRTETNDIFLSYEVVQTYACKGYNKKVASVPIVELS